jgi:hypothetical protein
VFRQHADEFDNPRVKLSGLLGRRLRGASTSASSPADLTDATPAAAVHTPRSAGEPNCGALPRRAAQNGLRALMAAVVTQPIDSDVAQG